MKEKEPKADNGFEVFLEFLPELIRTAQKAGAISISQNRDYGRHYFHDGMVVMQGLKSGSLVLTLEW